MVRIQQCHSSFDGIGSCLADGHGGGSWRILVQFHELGKIELGFLKDLDLSDHAVVLEWEDLAAFGLDLFANFFFKAIELKIINYIFH